MRCGIKVGFFLVRPCGEPASSFCVNCKQPVCKTHLRPTTSAAGVPSFVCISCVRRSTRSDTDYTDNTSSRSSSSSSDTDSFVPGGGTFAGGGATGDWVEAAPMSESSSESAAGSQTGSALTDAVAATGLSSEEVSAFDEISDFDKDSSRSEAYDS